jgi:hypothetical protein
MALNEPTTLEIIVDLGSYADTFVNKRSKNQSKNKSKSKSPTIATGPLLARLGQSLADFETALRLDGTKNGDQLAPTVCTVTSLLDWDAKTMTSTGVLNVGTHGLSDVVLAWSKLDWMDPKVVDLLARPLSELTESNTVHLHRIGFDDLQNGLVILDLVAPPESCAP